MISAFFTRRNFFTECYLPDHEFVVTTADIMVGIGSREEIIGDVGTDIVALVAPLGHAGDAANVTDEPLGAELLAGVGVALDIVLAAGPVPVGVPRDAAAVDVVDVRALVAGAGAGAPFVVVEVPALVVVVVELTAELLALGQSQRREEEGEGGLHLDDCADTMRDVMRCDLYDEEAQVYGTRQGDERRTTGSRDILPERLVHAALLNNGAALVRFIHVVTSSARLLPLVLGIVVLDSIQTRKPHVFDDQH